MSHGNMPPRGNLDEENSVEVFYVDEKKTLRHFKQVFTQIPESPFISFPEYSLILYIIGQNVYFDDSITVYPYEEFLKDNTDYLKLNIPLSAFRQRNELIKLDFSNFYIPDPPEGEDK